MNAKKAIANADRLRMSAATEEQKYAWLYDLEGRLAETYGVETPMNPFPEDAELMVQSPYDNVYELYLVAQIDYYNQETTLYANDMQMFNTAFAETIAHFRRNNRPKSNGHWRVG